MKLVYKYFFKEMVLPVFFGISVFTFLFLIDFLIEMMENIIVKNIPVMDVLEMVSYYFPPILSNTIPMGLFLGVMLSYNKLSGNSEIIAMESIGVGFITYLIPAFVVGFIMLNVLFFIEEKVIPDSFEKLELVTKKIAYTRPALKLEEKTFIEDIGDHSIYINKMDNDANLAENLIVFQKLDTSIYPRIILADRSRWENSTMILENANFYNINSNGEKEIAGSFEKQIIPINTFFGNFSLKGKKKRAMMSITELKTEIDNIYGHRKTEQNEINNKIKILKKKMKRSEISQKEFLESEIVKLNKEKEVIIEKVKEEIKNIDISEKKRRKIRALPYEAEMHQKLAVPFSALLLAILGVFFSVKSARSGKGASFVFSIAVIFSYMTIIGIAKQQAIKLKIDVVLGMWSPNILLLILILILFIIRKRRVG
ncbi:MAG: YjgP/YjgQ family permease [Fusobacteria bacterium]|nr:YjgP/YjgQ family permease [Fusobacteriota bacterium]